jgi:hypothetical protein
LPELPFERPEREPGGVGVVYDIARTPARKTGTLGECGERGDEEKRLKGKHVEGGEGGGQS